MPFLDNDSLGWCHDTISNRRTIRPAVPSGVSVSLALITPSQNSAIFDNAPFRGRRCVLIAQLFKNTRSLVSCRSESIRPRRTSTAQHQPPREQPAPREIDHNCTLVSARKSRNCFPEFCVGVQPNRWPRRGLRFVATGETRGKMNPSNSSAPEGQKLEPRHVSVPLLPLRGRKSCYAPFSTGSTPSADADSVLPVKI